MGSILTTFLLIGLVGCGGDDDDGMSPEIDDLIGTWIGTSLLWTEVGGAATFDAIAAGDELTFVVRNDFTYTVTQVDPGPPSQVTFTEDGIFAVNGSVLTLTPDGEDPVAYEIVTLTSTALTLFLADDEYDFNDDDNDTPATLTIVFVKQ